MVVLLLLVMLLAACGEDGTESAEPPPTATNPPPTSAPAPPPPPTVTVTTTLPDGSEMGVSYPVNWVAEEVQPGQIEIATNRDALYFLTEPNVTLNPDDLVGQISAIPDAEVAANAGLDADAGPGEVLLAIVTAQNLANAFGDAAAITPEVFTVSGNPAARLTTTFTLGESARSLYLLLLDYAGVRVFMFFSAEGEPGVMAFEADILALAESISYTPAERSGDG